MVVDSAMSAFDDGLICPEVGAWAEDKHRLVSLYSTLFSSGMKGKWDRRIYLELYAGAGYSRIRGTQRIIAGSPLLALTVKDPFDEYVFCEENAEKIAALRVRVKRHSSTSTAHYIEGDCSAKIDEILAAIPRGAKNDTVLTLCFADPFDIGLRFDTIRALSNARYVDFLITLALGMDANRNYELYAREDAVKVDEFLGSRDWRRRWVAAQWDAIKFSRFLATEFTQSMTGLGYIPPPFYTMKEIRSHEKNLPLYHLALFSRHERAYKFWEEVLKYSTDQRKLF